MLERIVFLDRKGEIPRIPRVETEEIVYTLPTNPLPPL